MKKIIYVLALLLFSLSVTAEEGKTENKESEERLQIKGRVQFRGVAGEEDSIYSNGGSDYNSVDWNFRRLRLGAIYNSEMWGTIIDLALENVINKPYTTTKTATDPVSGQTYVTSVSDHDNKGAIVEANIWLNIPFMKSQLKMGQFKVPFMRELLQSSGTLIMTEFSMVDSGLQIFDIGLLYSFKPLVLVNRNLENYMTVDLSVTNGHGSSMDGVGSRQVETNSYSGSKPVMISPLYTWRVEINPFGGLVKNGKDAGWSEGNEIFQKDTKLSIGIAGASISEMYLGRKYSTSTRGAPSIDIINAQTTPTNGDGENCNVPSDETSPCRPRFGLSGRTYDFTFTSHGLYLNGAYTKFSGSASNKLHGYQGTIGYVIPVKKSLIMPVFRYDYMAGDFDHNTNITDDEIFRNYWAGVNFYIRRNSLKLQVMYQIQKDKLGQDPRTGTAYDMKNNLVYFQVQSDFNTGVSLAK